MMKIYFLQKRKDNIQAYCSYGTWPDRSTFRQYVRNNSSHYNTIELPYSCLRRVYTATQIEKIAFEPPRWPFPFPQLKH